MLKRHKIILSSVAQLKQLHVLQMNEEKTIMRVTFGDGRIVVNMFCRNWRHTKRWQVWIELEGKHNVYAFCHV